MTLRRVLILLGMFTVLFAPSLQAADDTTTIPKGAKFFIAPQDGFENYLSAAMLKKGVPIGIVVNREMADFEIVSTARTDKAGWAKTLLTRNSRSDEHASITVTNIKSGVVVYAYAYNMGSAINGQQSAAESCAKHLKERIEKGK